MARDWSKRTLEERAILVDLSMKIEKVAGAGERGRAGLEEEEQGVALVEKKTSSGSRALSLALQPDPIPPNAPRQQVATRAGGRDRAPDGRGGGEGRGRRSRERTDAASTRRAPLVFLRPQKRQTR